MSREDWKEWIQNAYDTKTWVQKTNLDIDPEVIRAEKFTIYSDLIKNELELKPGASSAVELLSKEYQLALASGSRMDTIKPIIEKFKLGIYFEKLLSDKDVERAKPYPDVFLHVADLLNVEPNECVVIEDSIAGLKAAMAAGMKCIICPDAFTDLPFTSFKNADKIIESLEELTLKTIEELS